jgi:hypothetical protein
MMRVRVPHTRRFVAVLAACAGLARPAAATPQAGLQAAVQGRGAGTGARRRRRGPLLPTQVTLPVVLQLLDGTQSSDAGGQGHARRDRRGSLSPPDAAEPSISYGGTHLFQGLSTGAVTQHQVVWSSLC